MNRLVSVAGTVRHMKGWKPDRPDPRDRRLVAPEAMKLPSKIDLRDQCPPIVDQGQIGSCTANSSSAAMAFLERKGKADTYFSKLFIYARTRQLEGTPLSEDSGAEIRTVMKALSKFGAPYEIDYPYDPDKFTEEPPAAVAEKALEHKALMYYRCPNLFTLRASLAQGFPVVIGFSVPDNMMSDRCTRTGIVMPPEPGEAFDGGHAVMAIGYDTAFSFGHIEYGGVFCQNSWGEDWGIQGCFWLPMSFFRGGPGALASDFWTIRRVASL